MKVSVVGASGYMGAELLRWLAVHPDVEIATITSRRNVGKKVWKVLPSLRGFLDIEFSDISVDKLSESDLVFLAVPHGASMNIVPSLLDLDMKIIDLSADFRLPPDVYEAWYGRKHTAPDVRAVYGLPEIRRNEIRKSRLVANPGCFPTSVILGLAPLISKGIVDTRRIIVDSKTGISGAGAEPTERTHYPNVAENVSPYAVVKHRHIPEMEIELERLGGKEIRISFTPHVVPVIRGILSTIHVFLEEDISEEGLRDLYKDFYEGEIFVRILEVGEIPRLSSVRGTNFCDIGGFFIDERVGRAVIFSAIDNLGKGGSAQAVQNMNIMMGLNESRGLLIPSIYP